MGFPGRVVLVGGGVLLGGAAERGTVVSMNARAIQRQMKGKEFIISELLNE